MGLFILTNKVYPFDRHEGAKRMYQRQIERDYHLQADIQAKTSPSLKNLIDLLLEPVAGKRPSIGEVIAHSWVPIIHQEAAYLSEKSAKSKWTRIDYQNKIKSHLHNRSEGRILLIIERSWFFLFTILFFFC